MKLSLKDYRILRDSNPDAASAGGGSFLGGADGGSNGGTPLSDGSGGDGGTSTPPTNSGNPTPPGQGNWFDSLPKELKENKSVTKYTSVEALAGAYVNAQKIIGADKIAVPTKHTTDDEWRQVFHKLGLPEKAEEYAVKFKDGAPLDADFQKALSGQLHKLGVLPKQAQALADWMVEESSKAVVTRTTKAADDFKKQESELKALWGSAFDKNVHHANKFLMEKGGADLYKYANDRGWGADAKFIQFLASAAEAVYGEAPALGEGGAGEMSPKDLDAEIRRLQAEPAYFDKGHPSHKAIVEEVKDLYAKRYPVDK